MTADPRLPELVSIACHDISAPLATVYGFARTLLKLGLDEPASRYVEMIDAASLQMGELVKQLSMVARIERGLYAPMLEAADSLELAHGAAEDLEAERLVVSGHGAAVSIEPEATRRALAQLARAAARYGGHDSVSFEVRGAELELAPVGRVAAPVVLGEDAKELSAAASALHVRAIGGSLEEQDGRLLIRLPAA